MNRIYLDNHATTPLDPRVLEVMLPFFGAHFGNAASSHGYGREAAEAVVLARGQVGQLIGAEPLSIIFTSGATESINLALKGLAQHYGSSRRHIVTCQTEHPAVLDCCEQLRADGFEVTLLPVDDRGRLAPEVVAAALREDTLVLSLMLANNEIGTIHDMAAIAAAAKERGVFVHCDAAQAAGKLALDVNAMGIDLLSLSGHKLYGPKGIGALYIRRKNPRVRLAAQMHGGGHERGYRSGTLNVPLIAGLGKACVLAQAEWQEEAQRLATLREDLLTGLRQSGTDFEINGTMRQRLPGNLNLRFPAVPASALMSALPEIAMSAGAACSSARPGPSPTLLALGLGAAEAAESVRLGLGRFTTAAEINKAVQRIAAATATIRADNPVEQPTCTV